MRMIEIKENDAGQRLDKFLMKFMPSMPKSMLYKLIRKKDIKYNQKRCQGNEILRTGDILHIYAKEEFFENPKSQKQFHASHNRRFQLIFENQNIMIVWKPIGQDVHSSDGKQGTPLIDEIQNYLYQKGEYQPHAEQSFAPALCNRIDRNTQGLVIAAKNAAALRAMNETIREHQIQKSYLAVTAKPLPKKHDICTAWLKKSDDSNQVRISDKPLDKTWHEIKTSYEVLSQNNQHQLVRIQLLTGRTHQIRAHLAHLGAPLLGDAKYGGRTSSEKYQCLCAYQLRFSGLTADILSDLEGKIITAPAPDFVQKYFPDIKLSDAFTV